MRAAAAHHQAGRLRDAEALYRRVLAAVPRHADALDLLGVVAWQSGHPAEALDLIGRAIAIDRRNPTYHLHCGLALVAAGRRADAIKSLRRAAKLAPDSEDAHYNLGLALRQDGDLDGAVQAIRKAVRINPGNAEAHNTLGAILAETGRLAEAEAALRRSLALRPDSVAALNNLASVLLEREKADAAVSLAEEGLDIEETPDGHFVMGQIREHQGALDDALQHYNRCLDLAPGMLPARINLGNVLRALQRYKDELDHNRETARLNPESKLVLNNYATSLLDWARHPEAVAERETLLRDAEGVLDRVIRLDPNDPVPLLNRAKILEELGRGEETFEILDRIIARDPDRCEMRVRRSLLRLRKGDCTGGADDFRWFWRDPENAHRVRPFDQPWWNGEPIPGGARLLVWADQGIGDVLLYGNLLPTLGRKDADVVLECDTRLVDLLARSFPDITVIPSGTPPNPAASGADVAYQTPLSGLMYCLGPWPDGFPRRERCLKTDRRRVAQCRTRLDAALGPGPRVGIAW